MNRRTSLLINCCKAEAQEVRRQAKRQRRTVSGYVMNIVLRSVEFDDQLFAELNSLRMLHPKSVLRAPGPRTTLHLYCSAKEAKRVRNAAKRRGRTISGLVLHSLHRSWEAALKISAFKAPSQR